jgi:hypothetical protein
MLFRVSSTALAVSFAEAHWTASQESNSRRLSDHKHTLTLTLSGVIIAVGA